MSRLTFLCFAVAGIIGIMTFGIKQRVAAIEDRLNATVKEIKHLEEAMHVLSAEWTYLTNPSRLKTLAEKHLHMVPGSSHYLARLEKKQNPTLECGDYDTQAMMCLAGQLGD